MIQARALRSPRRSRLVQPRRQLLPEVGDLQVRVGEALGEVLDLLAGGVELSAQTADRGVTRVVGPSAKPRAAGKLSGVAQRASILITSSLVFTSANMRAMVFSSASCVSR